MYNIGRVKSLFSRKERILFTSTDRRGYPRVTLCVHGRRTIRIHRLVAQTFITNPENKRECNHKDGVKLNNNVNNLEWVTSSENQLHAYKTGLKIFEGRKGEGSPVSKLTNENVIEMRSLKGKMLHKDISKKFNISECQVSTILAKKQWKHLL